MSTVDIRAEAPRPVILVIAPNGARSKKERNPNIPISPDEIAGQVCDCADEGASVAHIHARNPDGEPTQSREAYRTIIELIRRRSDIIVQVSIGGRGFQIEDLLDPLWLRPQAGSFPVNEFLDRPERAADLALMSSRFRSTGTLPEYDVKDAAGVQLALEIGREHGIPGVPCFGLVLGDVDHTADIAAKLDPMLETLPAVSLWWALKGGQRVDEVARTAVRRGGHLRTGLEDFPDDRSASGEPLSNVDLVRRATAVIHECGARLATIEETRNALGIRREVEAWA